MYILKFTHTFRFHLFSFFGKESLARERRGEAIKQK